MSKRLENHPKDWEFCYIRDMHCSNMKENKCPVSLADCKNPNDPCRACGYFKDLICTCRNEHDCPEWQNSHDSAMINQGG